MLGPLFRLEYDDKRVDQALDPGRQHLDAHQSGYRKRPARRRRDVHKAFFAIGLR